MKIKKINNFLLVVLLSSSFGLHAKQDMFEHFAYRVIDGLGINLGWKSAEWLMTNHPKKTIAATAAVIALVYIRYEVMRRKNAERRAHQKNFLN